MALLRNRRIVVASSAMLTINEATFPKRCLVEQTKQRLRFFGLLCDFCTSADRPPVRWIGVSYITELALLLMPADRRASASARVEMILTTSNVTTTPLLRVFLRKLTIISHIVPHQKLIPAAKSTMIHFELKLATVEHANATYIYTRSFSALPTKFADLVQPSTGLGFFLRNVQFFLRPRY